MHLIATLFRRNGYPNRLIQRTKHAIIYHKAPTANHTQNTIKTQNKDRNSDTTHISLPYIDETLTRRVNGVLRSSGLKARIAWTCGKSVSKHLVRSAFESPPCPAGTRKCQTCESWLAGRCHTKNVVYKITCKLCEPNPVVYIGETKRRVRDSFNEHIRDAKNKNRNTPFGDHVAEKHPTCEITATAFKIFIERVCTDVANLKIAESLEIRNQKPPLNSHTSSWPLLHPPPYSTYTV